MKFGIFQIDSLGRVIHTMAVIGYEGVYAAVAAKEPLIVDVRTEDEFAAGRIPGATNIPLSEV